MGMAAVASIIEQPDAATPKGLRDRFFMILLYDTGARVQEILDIKLCDLQLGRLPKVTLFGKGRKIRVVPLMEKTAQRHLFLSALYPHRPLEAGSIWHHAESVYKAAAIRRASGDRRGTHLFRHNVATSFLGSGVQHPVISQTLGHTDPGSLEPYLHADMAHLKECSLSIGAFPLGEEVLRI